MFGYIATCAAAAAASVAGYQTMSPAGQWYGRTFVGLPRGSKQLALTYDDGPNDPYTLRLLEVLARHDVRATFFLIGRYVTQRPDIVRELAKAGHAIGNHTFSHPNLIFASSRRTKLELQQCEQALNDAIGEHAPLFRPPFGGRRPGTLPIARRLGLEPIMWRVSGHDWKERPAEYIEHKIRRQVRGGDVILLHDGGHRTFGADRSQTVIATAHLLTQLKSEGYEFLTIPEIMSKVVLGK
jgi:peptidoglycan/xylan/chitin deacetylase (PgdA/CDA1 family)